MKSISLAGPVKKLLKQTAKEKGATTQEETIEFPLQSKQQVWQSATNKDYFILKLN